MDLSKYRQLFVSETQENLEKISRLVVELETRPDDRDAIDTLFRLAHSIKGMSGTMGYTPLFELAHRLEELMEQFRRHRIPFQAAAADLLLAGGDRMAQWVADVEAERLPLQVDEDARSLHERVRGLIERLNRGADVAAVKAGAARATRLDSRPGDVIIRVEIEPTCGEPGVRGFLVHRKLRDVGDIRSSVPSVDELRAGRLDGPLDVALQTQLTPEQIETYLKLIPELATVEVRRQGEPASPEADDFEFTGDLGLLGPAAPEEPAAPEPAAIVRARPPRTVRVRTDWLDTILNRTADLLIISQRLWNQNQQSPRPAISASLGELSKVLNALHADALSVRMTPLSVLTARLPRVVRDLARQTGKSASLAVRGDDQQLDRAIIEALDAPITHLIRNAIEHGIEPPAERKTTGKRLEGLLTLACTLVRDEMVVEIADDGAGIDRERLATRAVELGLLTRARAELLAERDLTRLVSHPGLTTQSEAGALAGRGVGMDAVVEAVAAMGGHVEVVSEPGAGTIVRLRVPRTPGISKLLLVEAQAQLFGLPLGRIINTDMFRADEVERDDDGATTIPQSGQRVPLYDLRGLLGFPEQARRTRFPGVVFSHEEGQFVVAVDRVAGQQDAIVKPLGPLLERVAGLVGVTFDAIGHPVFVVDVTRYRVGS